MDILSLNYNIYKILLRLDSLYTSINVQEILYGIEFSLWKTTCHTQDSFSLGLNSFWGLFLIAGITYLSALLICAAIYFPFTSIGQSRCASILNLWKNLSNVQNLRRERP